MQELFFTWIADFTMKGRLAYLSHQETLSLFERALVRAKMPLVFSSGFNPRPHLSIPLPRSVGLQSDAERICAIVSFSEPPKSDLGLSVSAQLPEGCEILNSSLVEGKKTYYPAGYRLRFSLDDISKPELVEHIQNCVKDQQSGKPIIIERYMAKKDAYKPLDIAPYLEKVELENKDIIDVRCRVTKEGTVRVDELLQWLKLQPENLSEPVRRIEVYWNTDAA